MTRRRIGRKPSKRATSVQTKGSGALARFWLRVGPPAAIIAVGIAVYSNSFRGGCFLDDLVETVGNPKVQRLWPLWETLPDLVTLNTRPTLSISLAANWQFGGENLWGFHAVNLGVHILAGLLLFGVVRRTLLSDRLRQRFGPASVPLALAVAILWLAHPLQTSSVTYIVQRAESMMGMFFLLTLYCAIRGHGSRRPGWWHAAAVVACVLGAGAKQVIAVAPLIVVLYDRVFLLPTFRQAFQRRKWLYAGLAVTWVVLPVLLLMGPPLDAAGFGVAELGPLRYAASQPGVIVHYLRLAFWPDPLLLDYGWPAAERVGQVLWPGLLVIALLAATLWALWRRPPWGFLGMWFFLILAPTSSIMPIRDLCFEHRMYLPLAAVVAGLVLAGYLVGRALLGRLKLPPAAQGVVALCVVAAVTAGLGWRTLRRNRDYHDEIVMWQDNVRHRQDNPRAHYNLGTALGKAGRYAEGVVHLRRAVELKPDYAKAHQNLGNALASLGEHVQAVEHYTRSLQLNPDDYKAHYNLARSLTALGQTDRAIEHYLMAIKRKPDYSKAHGGLGVLLLGKKRLDDAIRHLSIAVQCDPNDPIIRYNLGAGLLQQGHVDQAARHFRAALRIDPDFREARAALALCESAAAPRPRP